MRFFEREFSIFIVVEFLRGPAQHIVAVLALLAELTFVLVALLMTGKAIRRHIFVFPFRMTVPARNAFVFAFKRKLRLAMIVDKLLPLGFVVAAGAFITQTALMLVNSRMTADAFERHTLVTFLRMAVTTCDLFVFSTQRKLVARVIELELGPTRFVVAVFALFAKLLAMRILAAVAVVTTRRRLMILFIGGVTRTTARRHVPPTQGVVGRGMVESLGIEQHHRRVTTFVLGMARFALARFYVRDASVKSRARIDIARDVFMVMTF